MAKTKLEVILRFSANKDSFESTWNSLNPKKHNIIIFISYDVFLKLFNSLPSKKNAEYHYY